MKTRLAAEDDRLQALFQDVIAHARVFQGGGNEVTTSNVREAVETAVNRSLIRLFPRFTAGDNPNWGKVVTKARDGVPDALEAVGHHGDALTNPVCKELLDAISPGGTKGADLHKRFAAPDFGWPRDAINGAILVLVSGGHVLAKQDGKELAGPKELLPTQIGKVTLYKVGGTPPSPQQRTAVRGLMVEAGVAYVAGQEGPQIPALLQRLKDLAARAGGAPPLPELPDTAHLESLSALDGTNAFGPSPTTSTDCATTSRTGGPRTSSERCARSSGTTFSGSSATPPISPLLRRLSRRSPPSGMAVSSSTPPTRSHRYSSSSAPRCEPRLSSASTTLERSNRPPSTNSKRGTTGASSTRPTANHHC